MTKQKTEIENFGTDEAERCLECGIKLRDLDFAEIDGDLFCEQCAEDHVHEPRTHEPATSLDEFSIEGGARIH